MNLGGEIKDRFTCPCCLVSTENWCIQKDDRLYKLWKEKVYKSPLPPETLKIVCPNCQNEHWIITELQKEI